MATQQKRDLADKLEKYRSTSKAGNTIRMHRALRSLPFTPARLLTMVLLPVIFDTILWFNLDRLLAFWGSMFDFLVQRLAPEGHLGHENVGFVYTTLSIPFPDLSTFAPSTHACWMNVGVCVVLFVLSAFFSKRFMPLTYLFRAGLLIQISASVYFLINDTESLYSLANYITCMLAVGVYLMFLVSPMLAFIYYIFDFPLWRKITVTTVILAYFSIALPVQYMLHALALNSWGLLFEPVLYLLFALLLDTLMFVCWYSWAMTWRPRNQ